MDGQHQHGKIVIAGGSGYLGRVLAAHFAQQTRPVVILSRRKVPETPSIRSVQWDGETLGVWTRELDGADAVINLAGRTVNCRYNAKNRAEILHSRLRSTKVIGQAIIVSANAPTTWLNAGSATIYRDSLDYPMDERTGEIGEGFSVDVCQQWEKALFDFPLTRTRRVAMRITIVFGPTGDAFKMFHRIVRLGLGGKMGSGKQMVSWIHEYDFVRAMQFLIENPTLKGPVNLASPNPLPNKEFMRVFRQVCHRPIGLPAAKWMLGIGARFLGTETELILKSRYVVPGNLLARGFQFKFPTWPAAVENIVSAAA